MGEEDWKETWQKRLKKWLEEEKLGSPLMLDKCWEVEINENSKLTAESWVTPFVVDIAPIEEDGKRYLNFTVRTPVGTAMLHPDDKVNLYRTMLKLNQRSKPVKFGLKDIDDDIVVRADFHLSELSKEELDHGLRHQLEIATFLLSNVVTSDTLQEFIDEENWDDYEFYHTMGKFVDALEDGEISKEIVVRRLTDIGYEEERAEALVADLVECISEDQEQPSERKIYNR